MLCYYAVHLQPDAQVLSTVYLHSMTGINTPRKFRTSLRYLRKIFAGTSPDPLRNGDQGPQSNDDKDSGVRTSSEPTSPLTSEGENDVHLVLPSLSTMANASQHRYVNQNSKQWHVAGTRRRKTCVSKSRLVLVLLLIGWKICARFLTNHSVQYGRGGGLVVSVLDSGSSGPGLSFSWGTALCSRERHFTLSSSRCFKWYRRIYWVNHAME